MSKERQHYNCIPGYDMVARNEIKRNTEKIKELEKKIGSGGTQMVEKVVLEESIVCTGYTNNPEGLVKSMPTPTSLVLEDGRTYKIVIDGTDVYSGVARELQTPTPVIAIGNTAFDANNLGAYAEDTGENFLVYVATVNGATGFIIDIYNPEKYSYGDYTVNVKITTMEEKQSECLGSGVETLTFILEDDTAVDIKVVIAE